MEHTQVDDHNEENTTNSRDNIDNKTTIHMKDDDPASATTRIGNDGNGSGVAGLEQLSAPVSSNVLQYGPEIQGAANTLVSLAQTDSNSVSRAESTDHPTFTSDPPRRAANKQRSGVHDDPRYVLESPYFESREIKKIKFPGDNEPQPKGRCGINLLVPSFPNRIHMQGPFSIEHRRRQIDAQRHLRSARIQARKHMPIRWPAASVNTSGHTVHKRKFEPAQSAKEALVGLLYEGQRERGAAIMRKILHDLLKHDGMGEVQGKGKGKEIYCGKRKIEDRDEMEIPLDPRLFSDEWISGLSDREDEETQQPPSMVTDPQSDRLRSVRDVEQDVEEEDPSGLKGKDEEILFGLEDEDEYPDEEK